MSQAAKFAPKARDDLREAVTWLARKDENTARALRLAVSQAALRLGEHPDIGRIQPRLLPERYPVWSLSGFPYLLVYEKSGGDVRIVRIVHTSRDLPAALRDLFDPPEA